MSSIKNFTSLLNVTSPSLDELLDELGFDLWGSIMNTFILPPINFIGIALCSLSLWIFSRPSFRDPIFIYYKLLCSVNIILLLHNIPGCLFFSPRYFPLINTYAKTFYQIYYIFVSVFLYHFEEVLQMGIVLQKMKFFSPFVSRHFIAKPQLISLSLFLTCFFINLPFAFSFKVASFGTYFYFNSNGVKQYSTLYLTTSSDFSTTSFGKILLGFTSFFLNFFLSLLFGIIINVLSYIKYKSFSRKRHEEFEQLQMSSINYLPTITREMEQLRERARIEHRIERNMLYMALTLCTISIVSRLIFMACFVYFFIFYSLSNTLLIELSTNTIYCVVPTVSFFVFYSFNHMFSDETNRIFGLSH